MFMIVTLYFIIYVCVCQIKSVFIFNFKHTHRYIPKVGEVLWLTFWTKEQIQTQVTNLQTISSFRKIYHETPRGYTQSRYYSQFKEGGGRGEGGKEKEGEEEKVEEEIYES